MTPELIEAAARAIYDVIYGEGAWDNPGALPDEVDRPLWRLAAESSLYAALHHLTEPPKE